MVHLYFHVLAPVAGILGSAAGQTLCVHLGAEHNVALRNTLHIPEGQLYSVLGNALLDGTLEDVTPGSIPSDVVESLRLAVGEPPALPGPPAPSRPASPARPLTFRRWRRIRSPLHPVR